MSVESLPNLFNGPTSDNDPLLPQSNATNFAVARFASWQRGWGA